MHESLLNKEMEQGVGAKNIQSKLITQRKTQEKVESDNISKITTNTHSDLYNKGLLQSNDINNKITDETLLQRTAVIQCMLNMNDFMLATKISKIIGVKPVDVFNIMIANKGWGYEDDQEGLLNERIRGILKGKDEAKEKYQHDTFIANHMLQEFFDSPLNQETLDLIHSVSSTSAEYAVLYRGANPVQALKIMAQQTLGGAPERLNDLREPPTEEMQKIQTGRNIKEHMDSTGQISTLEEWSRGTTAKESFSKGGWVLKCIVIKTKTNYEDSLETTIKGEAGVVGWIETPCLVAIEKKGAEMI